MNELRKFNIELLKQFKEIMHLNDFSYPLLVSSRDEYLNNINKCNNRVLYIGQETNCWGDGVYTDDINDCHNIEQIYYHFLTKRNANNKEFWRFIRNILKIEKEDLGNNVIWSNSLIASKRDDKGTPDHVDEIKELSINNLVFLYEYFKPNYVIVPAGPRNPYYEIIMDFSRRINLNLETYPTLKQPLIVDSNNKFYWTYHPNYLNQHQLFNNVANKISEKILIK
jgi:hypothetical protein